MRTRTAERAEFGDFQTPQDLADAVCRLLSKQGVQPAALLEPTCGVGNFLRAAVVHFKSLETVIGADVNSEYVRRARATLGQRHAPPRLELVEANFFVTDWQRVIADLPEPVLVLGNLPWVTNADLGTLRSQNLPIKSNFQHHNGLDAITGKANFDISEWMLIRLLDAMRDRQGTLAMLCKASVARKILLYGWKNAIALGRPAIFRIDADVYFDAAVDAALLVVHFSQRGGNPEARVYPHLNDTGAETVIGYDNGVLLSDVVAYRRWKHLCAREIAGWRSGVKHDCSKVMEFSREGEKYRNGLGELIDLETTYLFPMLKSSQVAKGGAGRASRYMLVTQRTVGEDTVQIRQRAPRTWAYLNTHADLLNNRGSSIYRNRPQFSIFGVGDYTFAPWKVAISGFYKKLAFVPVGPANGKPVVLDDTSYFLPCWTKAQAEYLASLLNSPTAQAFYKAFVFWDAKRPITADLLRRLDLRRLATELGSDDQLNELFGPQWPREQAETQLELWPS